MLNHLTRFFTKSFQFSGRATRQEFWIPNLILTLVALLIGGRKRSERTEGIFTALIMLPSLSITSRRYQDAGISGWYQLPQYLSILLLPFAFMSFIGKGAKTLIVISIAAVNIAGLIFTLLPSRPANKYGPKPLN
ncbi:DUF805 domain-containing protein [Salinicoccus hispanicus]|uniref:DUF805 domain-containing protein n=1 Tax=Salinicoccus hispanicus TaxID=157225 RepID=A0A6N8U1N3_9STAP|nr:DUF805 domain-containing protein [Salinicoccus hispanicus]MXQ52118.1 DUF805 domain-containing protein [Salinicoccus hispanicus]